MALPKYRVFSWSQRADFRAFLCARGGAHDVRSGAKVPTDVDISERSARKYSASRPDSPGRTISFWCSGKVCGEYGTPGYVPCVVLTGCPWGTAAERDTTYRELALSAVVPDDMRGNAELMALVSGALGRRPRSRLPKPSRKRDETDRALAADDTALVSGTAPRVRAAALQSYESRA